MSLARSFNLNKPGITRHGAMIGFNNYPARPRVGMFNRLLSAPYPLVMSHSFRFRSSGGAVSALRLISQQMRNAGDAAEDLVEGLEEAANKTASLKTATGRHHFSLAVYASDRRIWTASWPMRRNASRTSAARCRSGN